MLPHPLHHQKRARGPQVGAEGALSDVGATRPVAPSNLSQVLLALAGPNPGSSKHRAHGFHATVTAVGTISQATAPLLCLSHTELTSRIQNLPSGLLGEGGGAGKQMKGQGNVSSDRYQLLILL